MPAVDLDSWGIGASSVASATRDAPELTYVYEQFDPGPIAVTDTKNHYGAGHLIYNAKQDQFAGEYWTQRNGDRGLNTAGTLVLRRRGREIGKIASRGVQA